MTDGIAPDRPIVNILGEKFALGPRRHELLPLIAR